MNRVPRSALPAGAASLMLAATLCACAPSADGQKSGQASGDPAAPPTVTAAVSTAPQPGAHDGELVTAVALNKVKLPVQVRFRLDASPVVGQPVKIELVVTPAQLAQIRSLQFRLQAGAGLALQGASELLMTGAAPGVAIRRDVVVVPQSAGILELDVLGTVETGSESLSQTYAIPLIVQPHANPG
jgi:hypothetical protein